MFSPAEVIGLAADNGPRWLAAEAWCRDRQAVCVPIPVFFTPGQIQWAANTCGMTVVLTDNPALPLWSVLGFESAGEVAGLARLQRDVPAVAIPAGTAKITFTSGSTGTPKGVCLSQSAMDAVAGSIAAIGRSVGLQKHLCLLPLAVLLENVAGADAARLAGVTCVAPSLLELGWLGSSQWDPHPFLKIVQKERIDSAILLPQLLKAILPVAHQYDLRSLRLLAVGGARVAPALLEQARAAGLPVYEGYGLSECASVVSWNHPGAEKSGTVGKALPHVQVRVSDIGELEVAGNAFLGYVGEDPRAAAEWLATGDLAAIDEEGFVSIRGRRKHVIISSFGRNISPEWVESVLLAQPGIVQAAVFGEAQPALAAVIHAPSLDDAALAEAISAANASLPDYARVQHGIRATESFSASFCSATNSPLATGNGRNRRDAIAVFYAQALQACYATGETTDV